MIVIVFLTALIASALAVGPIMRFLGEHGIYDVPNNRSIHKRRVLRMGGLIFIVGYFAAASTLYLAKPTMPESEWVQITGILVGAILIAVVGACDDYFNIRAKHKFVLQSLIACITCSFGITITEVRIFDFNYALGSLSLPLTVFWIVGITNAVNLLDGVDGLAGIVSLAILTTLCAINPGFDGWSILSLGLAGGLVVFLKHNAHPARIFMGDVGSLFLGFHLAVLSLKMLPVNTHQAGFLILILPLLLPIVDTNWAIARRLASGMGPFHADRKHIHHQLLSRGFNQKQTVLILFASTAFLCLFLAFLLSPDWVVPLVLLTLFITILIVYLFPLTRSQKLSMMRLARLPLVRFLRPSSALKKQP